MKGPSFTNPHSHTSIRSNPLIGFSLFPLQTTTQPSSSLLNRPPPEPPPLLEDENILKVGLSISKPPLSSVYALLATIRAPPKSPWFYNRLYYVPLLDLAFYVHYCLFYAL